MKRPRMMRSDRRGILNRWVRAISALGGIGLLSGFVGVTLFGVGGYTDNSKTLVIVGPPTTVEGKKQVEKGHSAVETPNIVPSAKFPPLEKIPERPFRALSASKTPPTKMFARRPPTRKAKGLDGLSTKVERSLPASPERAIGGVRDLSID